MSWNQSTRLYGLNMPQFDDGHDEERIYVVIDGRRKPVCNEDIARQDVAYYARQGIHAEIVKEMVNIRYEILW
jgi:hypothetical protein